MSKEKIIIKKQPDLLVGNLSDNTYRNLSESELLHKVKLLHEQVFKTNKYLSDLHRIALYNWDPEDVGNIMVEMPADKKGFLLDSILRLRGEWDPLTNTPQLNVLDGPKAGWVYRVNTTDIVEFGDTLWKTGDYALYDEEGKLYNVSADLLKSLFTPVVTVDSDTILFNKDLEQSAGGIYISADVKIDPTIDNDISASAKGLYSAAYTKAKRLISVQQTPPTGPNTHGGLRLVVLEESPEVYYDGWLYLIPPAVIVKEE